MLQNYLKKPTLIDLFLSSILILLSGSLFPFIFGKSYSIFLVIGLVIFIFYLLYKGIKVRKSYITLSLIILFISTLSCSFNEDFGIGYFGFIARLTIALLFVSIVPFDRFITCYSYVLYYICIISLVFTIFGYFTDINSLLPIMYNDAGTKYSHLFLYFYQGGPEWNYRNSGIFWEGGAFALFITIALVFCVKLKTNKIGKKKFIFLVTLLTTLSSVAFIVITIILCNLFYNYIKAKNISYSKRFIVLSLFPIIISLNLPFLIDHFIYKLNFSNISFLDRVIGMKTDLVIISENPFFGVGLIKHSQIFKDYALMFGSYAPSSTNSYLGLGSIRGLIYATIFSLLYFIFIKRQELGLSRSLILVMLPVFQGVFSFPIFYSFILFGILKKSKL